MNDPLRIFNEVRVAMEKGSPAARYIKASLGRVSVKIIDPLTGYPTEIILEGDPSKKSDRDKCVLNLWSPLEVAYFERSNKYHLMKGSLIAYKEQEPIFISPNQVTDEELREALAKKFMAVKVLLDKFTSPVPAQRMLAIAEEMDKPIGTINAIKSRLSELQVEEYTPKEENKDDQE